MAFPDRKGWYYEYWSDLQRWAEVPSWFRPWAEYEMSTATIRTWSPGVIDGLLQTEGYARALVSASPGVTPDKVDDRVANRMARQKRVLFRDDPPRAWFLVGITSLRSMPPHIMAGQLCHLLEVAALPNVTIQVVPECWHGGLPGGFIVADRAAYVESLIAGQVYADTETVSALADCFDTIRAETMRSSESLVLIREMLSRERLAKVNLLKRNRRCVPGDRKR
jgi:hypothetical protein